MLGGIVAMFLLVGGCSGGNSGTSSVRFPLPLRWMRGTERGENSFSRYVMTGADGTVYAFAGPRSSDAWSEPDTVYAIHPRSGMMLWKFTADMPIRQRATQGTREQSPMITAETSASLPVRYTSPTTVVVKLPANRHNVESDTLYGLDTATGNRRWVVKNVLHPVEAVGNQLVMIDWPSAREVRFIAPETGATVRSIQWNGEQAIEEMDTLPDAVLVHDGRHLTCYEAATGTPRWTIPYHGGTTVGNQSIFTAQGRPEIYAISADNANAYVRLDPATGRELWRGLSPVGGEIRIAIAVDGTPMVHTNGENKMHVLNADDGTERWSVYLGPPYPSSQRGQGVSSSFAAGGTVYVMTSEYVGSLNTYSTFVQSHFVAYDLQTGVERWRMDSAESPIYGPAATTSDSDLVFIIDQTLVCLNDR
jgi:outer membrane protein assembly factor BamB